MCETRGVRVEKKRKTDLPPVRACQRCWVTRRWSRPRRLRVWWTASFPADDTTRARRPDRVPPNPPLARDSTVFWTETKSDRRRCYQIFCFLKEEEEDVIHRFVFRPWFCKIFISALPTTMSGFQHGHFGAITERRCSQRLIVLRRLITSKLPGGMIISLNFPKSQIWKRWDASVKKKKKIKLPTRRGRSVMTIITSEREDLHASWTHLWHQQHHQSVRPGSMSHSSSQM